ncbi:MAG: PIG-L family deacetylase [Bryobacteraceae bacterium]|nr:PIG-L family deacetylase [Bryobacteraceae bacterium]
MPRLRFWIVPVLLLTLLPAGAQRSIHGTAEIKLALDRLNVLGSVLMVAAHPDDENTALLAYLARGKKYRTAYLSLTRGEGGQNLIGAEQGDEIGIIRTQELLAARKIDGSEQFFSRAVDFGFSKTADEALTKWGRDEILADTVWAIRRFRPDVIITRFSGTPRDGHGQHQASALLGKEGFTVAADASRFPEQLKMVGPWQAKRLMFNLFSFRPQDEAENAKIPNKVEVDTGDYDPVLGFSYNEIAGASRSQHKSQGMGSPERKGSSKNQLLNIGGDPAKQDLFDGIDTTWNRVPNGAPIGDLLRRAADTFRPENPAAIVPLLLDARKLMAANQDPWAARKLIDLDETIALCTGLYVDLLSDREQATPGSTLKVTANAIVRTKLDVQWKSVTFNRGGLNLPKFAGGKLPYNQNLAHGGEWTLEPSIPVSQPYWLTDAKTHGGGLYTVPDPAKIGNPENDPLMMAKFTFSLNGTDFSVERPIQYRFVDRAEGELTRNLIVVPPVALRVTDAVVVFPDQQAKTVTVEVRANVPKTAGKVSLALPAGFTSTPASADFALGARGEQTAVTFSVKPSAPEARLTLKAVATVDGADASSGMETIQYPHFAPQSLFPTASAILLRTNVRSTAKRVGYIMGAGDEVPAAIRQLGAEVTLLGEGQLATATLKSFDAIVTGIRAYNSRADLRANQSRLMDYVKQGGTMVVQYNVAERGGPFNVAARGDLARVGPYPLTVGNDRVTVEEAPIERPNPRDPLLLTPNKIGDTDFLGWVQERGLYFPSEWDPQYVSLFACKDPGEKLSNGATLVARYGAGTYIYSPMAWFRQLPAGVPGAYRIFANFLSARAPGAK